MPQERSKTPSHERGSRVVTPAWLSAKRERVAELRRSREISPLADTTLIIPAAQHPLVGGTKPNPEFETRLAAALTKYKQITERGDKAEFFLTGNRHHDAVSGQTDDVALYDASGLWLMDHGVSADVLHGKDWLDAYCKQQYNGAAEIGVAAQGFRGNERFLAAMYFCSPGQRKRATIHALAYELPLTVVVPSELLIGPQSEQFHARSLQQFALDAITRTIDPYGTGLLARKTVDRVPADGNVGTVPTLLPDYARLPWYAQSVA